MIHASIERFDTSEACSRNIEMLYFVITYKFVQSFLARTWYNYGSYNTIASKRLSLLSIRFLPLLENLLSPSSIFN